MKTAEARQLGDQIALSLRHGRVDGAYAQLAPILNRRTGTRRRQEATLYQAGAGCFKL